MSNPTAVIVHRGHEFGPEDWAWIESLADSGDRPTRLDIAWKVCERLNWRRPNGRFAIDSCRLFLARIEKMGLIRLPVPLRGSNFRRSQIGDLANRSISMPASTGPLDVSAVRLELALGQARRAWCELMQRYHYLGAGQLIGETLCYYAKIDEQPVALLGWGPAALKNSPRDRLVGWSNDKKHERLYLVCNNFRFLVLPWARQKNLASLVLGANLRRLSADFEQHFGHPILLAETFVDQSRFLGTCYLASNWQHVGETRGFARRGTSYTKHGNKKAVFLYALHRHAKEKLLGDAVPTPRSPRRTKMLNLEQLPKRGQGSLYDALANVTDPRKPRGIRHPLQSVLAICTAATVCGCKSLEAIADWAKEQPVEVLKKLGCERKKPPSEPTIRRVLKATGANLDRVSTEWFQSFSPLKGQAIAIDGKTLRGSGHADDRAAHLVSAVTHQRGEVLAQTQVPDKTNEITCIDEVVAGLDLRGAVVTMDALLTQRQIARHLVEDKGADYVLVAKDNQPSLKDDIARVDWDAIPPSAPND